MDNLVDHWSYNEWRFWRWLSPWSMSLPPPHNGCGCCMWIIILVPSILIMGFIFGPTFWIILFLAAATFVAWVVRLLF